MGLNQRVRPSLAAVDQRRSQLLVVMFFVMLALAIALLLLWANTGHSVEAAEFTHIPAFRLAPFLLVVGLIWYIAEKEKHLRRLTLLVLDDQAIMADLAHAVRHDPLTGVLSRSAFLDRLDDALARSARQHRPVGVLFVDLDDFKSVNDTWGHHTGDLVLTEVGSRLSTSMRNEDCVARFGGDEFTALVEGLVSEEEVLVVAERVKRALRAPLVAGDHPLGVSASIGVAVSGTGEASPFDLLTRADLAMYWAKTEDPGGYRLFNDSLLRPRR